MSVQIKNTSASYGFVSQWFHWIMAVLIIATFIAGIVFENTERSDPNIDFISSLHKSLGMLVLVSVLFRIVWRLVNPAPELPKKTPTYLRLISWLVHWILYALMILLPVSGIVASFKFGIGIDFFQIFTIESPLQADRDLAREIMDIHHILTKVLFAILVLHIVASLKHHFWDRDDVLVRMLDIKQPFFSHFKK